MVGSVEVQVVFPGESEARAPGTLTASPHHWVLLDLGLEAHRVADRGARLWV